jgi:hypothetical protein
MGVDASNDGLFFSRHARASPSEGRRRFRSPMSRPSTFFEILGKKDVDARDI